MKYQCPCCGYYTFEEKLTKKNHEICPVCFWENDMVQNKDPDFAGGANRLSLNESRKNFQKFGASSENVLQYVREPNEDEYFMQ